MPNETAPLQTGAPPASEDPNIQNPPADTPEPTEAEQVDAFLTAMRGEEVPDDENTDPAPAEPSPAPAAPAAQATTDPAAPAPPAAAPAPAPAAPDQNAAKVEAEIAELGIKNERTATRFRELSARAQDADTLRAQVEELRASGDELQAGIARLTEWEDRITQTGASPEQFASSMGYLELVNSGDPARMERAFSMIEDEYRNMGKLLGKEVVGGADPLDDHPDLKAKVASHDMDRADALRWAEERNRTKIATTAASMRDERDTQAFTVQQGIQSIATLGAELRKTDPLFEQKFALIAPLVNELQRTHPPERWAQGVRDLWARIPAIPAPAPAPAPSGQPAKKTTKPLRPGVTSAGQVRSSSDPVDGFLAAATGGKPV